MGRWRQLFVVAVNCTKPGGPCFCASMGTAPAAGPGYDRTLTERLAGDEPSYLVEVGTPEGAEVLAAVPRRADDDDETDCARADVAAADPPDGPPDAGNRFA